MSNVQVEFKAMYQSSDMDTHTLHKLMSPTANNTDITTDWYMSDSWYISPVTITGVLLLLHIVRLHRSSGIIKQALQTEVDTNTVG